MATSATPSPLRRMGTSGEDEEFFRGRWVTPLVREALDMLHGAPHLHPGRPRPSDSSGLLQGLKRKRPGNFRSHCDLTPYAEPPPRCNNTPQSLSGIRDKYAPPHRAETDGAASLPVRAAQEGRRAPHRQDHPRNAVTCGAGSAGGIQGTGGLRSKSPQRGKRKGAKDDGEAKSRRRSKKVKKRMPGLVRNVEDATEHASHKDGRGRDNEVSGPPQEYLPPRPLAASPLEESESIESRVRAKLRAAVEGTGDGSTKAVVLGRRSTALTRPMDLSLEDMLHLSQSMGHLPCTIADEHRSSLQLFVEADRARPNTTSTCIEGQVIVFDADMQLVGSAAPASLPVVGVECHSLSVTPNGLRSRHEETEALVIVRPHLLPKDVNFVALAVRSPREQSWVDHGGGVCRGRTEGQAFAPLRSRSFRFVTKQSKVEDVAGVSKDVCEGEGVAAQEASSIWKSSWQRIPPQSMVLCGVMYRHAYKPGVWLTKMIEPVEAMARPFSLFEGLAGIVDDLRANGVVPYHLLHIEYERCIGDSSTTTSPSSRLADDIVQAVRATLPPMAITVTGNSTQCPQDSFELTFKRYGPSGHQLVYSKLLSHSFPTVQGVVSWLSVATLTTPPYSEHRDTVRLLICLFDAYTGRPLSKTANVELHQVEVIISKKSIFRQAEYQPHRTDMPNSKQRRRSLVRPRTAWGPRDQAADQESMKKATKRSHSPHERGSAHRIVRTMARRASDDHAMQIDEEAEVDGFLADYMPRDERRRLISAGGITNMLILLGLDEEDLEDLGVRDAATRRKLFQAILKARLCIQSGGHGSSAVKPLRTPIDLRNPFGLSRLEGWSDRSDCVSFRRLEQITSSENGRAVMRVSDRGACIVRVEAQAYHRADSEVFKLTGEGDASVEVTVSLWPRRCTCIMTLTDVNKLQVNVQTELQGEPIELINIHAGRSHVAHIQPTLTAEWSIPAGFYTIAGIPNSITCINPAEGKAAPLKLNALVLLHALHRRRNEASGRIVRFLSHAATSDAAPRDVEGQPRPSAAECTRPPERTDYVGVRTPRDNPQGLRRAHLEFAASRTVDDGRDNRMTRIENCDTAPTGDISQRTYASRLAPAQGGLRLPQVDQLVGEKPERREDEQVTRMPSQAWRPIHPDNLCPTILVSADGDVHTSMPETGLPEPSVGAREARQITAGLRESTAAALTSLAGSVERRDYIDALGSVVKIQAFIRMMLAYLPYTRRKSRTGPATASDGEDDYSCDFCSRAMSPASDDGDGATPAEADAPSALEGAPGIVRPERAAGETTSEVSPEPVGEPPPTATQRGSRSTMPEADAVVVLQKTVRRFVAQKKAAQLLMPFTAVLRLIDLNGLAVVTWVKNIEWYFSIIHRDCAGRFKSILKTRTARVDTSRVLGQGFLLRNVRITDQIEISLMCRVLVKHGRGERTDLRKKGYKTIQEDLASPWACLYERDVHLMALDNMRQRVVLPLNGRGGRYQVPLLSASGLENIVASWVVDGCFKINVNAPWPRGAAAEALPPAAAFKQEQPVLYVEAFPVPYHTTRTLSFVCRNVHLLDAPLLQSVGRLESSMSAITAMTSWGEDVFVLQQDRILSQWGYTHSRGWRASRATQLQGPCSAISTLGPFILAGLADGVLVGYRKDTTGLDAVFEAVVHDSRIISITALSHTSSGLFVAGAENGHVALVTPAMDPQLRWSWRTVSLDVGSSITSLASSTVALYVGGADTQVYAYGLKALLSDEMAHLEAYAVFTGHSDAVQSLVCSKAQFAGGAGEELLFTGGADGRIFVLRADTLGFIGRLEGHLMGVTSLVLDDGGRYLISTSLDSSIRMWDILGLWCERCIEGSAVTTCVWNNVLLTSGSCQGQVDVWGMTELGEAVDHSETHHNRLQRYAADRCITEHDKGLTLLGGSSDQLVARMEKMLDAGDPRVGGDVDGGAVVAESDAAPQDSSVQEVIVSADIPCSLIHGAEIITGTTPRDRLNATEHVSSPSEPSQTEGAAGDAGSTIDVVLTEVTTTSEACTEPVIASTKTVIFYTSSPSAGLSHALDPMLPPASTLHKSLKSSRRGVSASTPRLGRVLLPQDSPTRSPATSPVRTYQLNPDPGPPSSTCQLAEDTADTCERDVKAQSMVLDEPIQSETRSCLEQDSACGPATTVANIDMSRPSSSCDKGAVERSAATGSVAEGQRSTLKDKETDEAGVYETECMKEGKALQADLPYHTVELNGSQCGLDISLSAERFETVVDAGNPDAVLARGSAEHDEVVSESAMHLSYVQDSQTPRSPAEGRRGEAACKDGLITSVDSPDYEAPEDPVAQVAPDDSLSSFLLVPLHVFTKSLPGGDEVSISIYARHDGGFVLEGRVLRVKGMCCTEIVPGDLPIDLPSWDSISEVERFTAVKEVQDVVTVDPIRLQKGKGQLVFTLDGDLADFKADEWLVTLAMEAGVAAEHLSIIDITAGSVVVRVLTTERLGYSVWEQYQHGRVRCNGTIKRVEFFTGRVRITLRKRTAVSDQKPQLCLSWATDAHAPIVQLVDAAEGRFSDAEGSSLCADSRASPSHRQADGAHVQSLKEKESPSSEQIRQHREIQPGSSSFLGQLQSREAGESIKQTPVAGLYQDDTSNTQAVVAVVECDASADTAVAKGGMVKESLHVNVPDHGEATSGGKSDLIATFPTAPAESISESTINDLGRTTPEMTDGRLDTGLGLSYLPDRMTTETDTRDFMATLLEGATQTLHSQQAPAEALSTMGESHSEYDATRDSTDDESGDEGNGLIFVSTLHISNSHVLVSLYATPNGGMTVYGLCPATSERLSLDLQPSDWAVTGYADLRQLNSEGRSALAAHIIAALELPPATDRPLSPRRLCLGSLCASPSRAYRNLGSTDMYENTLKHFLRPSDSAPLKETLRVSSPTGTWHKHTWRHSVSRLSQEYVKAFGDHTALLSMRTTSQKDVEVTGYVMETQEELNLTVSNSELACTLSPPRVTPELHETWAEDDEPGAGGCFRELDSLAHNICLADVGGRATLVLQPGLQRPETEAVSSIEHNFAAGGEPQPAGAALTCLPTDPSPTVKSISVIDDPCRSSAHSAHQDSQTPHIHPRGDTGLVFDKVNRISMQWVRVMMCELQDGRLLCEAASPTIERLQILVDDMDWAITGMGPWQSLSSHERQDLLNLVASHLHLSGTVGAQSLIVDWDAVRGPGEVPLTAHGGLRLTTPVSEAASKQATGGLVERATVVITAVESPVEDAIADHAMVAATTQCAHEPQSSSAAMEQHPQSAGAISLAPAGGSRQSVAANQPEANAIRAFEQHLPISSTSLPDSVGASAGSAKDRQTVTTSRSPRSTTSTAATCYVSEVMGAALSPAMENRQHVVQYVALRPSAAQHSQDRLLTARKLCVAEGSQAVGAADTLAQEPFALHTAPTTNVAPPDEAKGPTPSFLTGALSDLAGEDPVAESFIGPHDHEAGATPPIRIVTAIGPPAGGGHSKNVNRQDEHEDDRSPVCGPGNADISRVAAIAELNLPTHGAFARATLTQSTVTTPRSSRSTTSTVATCYVTEMMDAAVSHVMEKRLGEVQHVTCQAPSAQQSQNGLVTATQPGVAEGSPTVGAADTLIQESSALHTAPTTDIAPRDEAKGRSPSSLTGALSDLAREGPATESLTVPNDQEVGATPAIGVGPASGPPARRDHSKNVIRQDEHVSVTGFADLNLPTPGDFARAAQTQSMVTTPRSSRSTTSTVATCYVNEMMDAAVSHAMESRRSEVQHVGRRAPSAPHSLVTSTQLGVAEGSQDVGAADTLAQESCALHTAATTDVAPPDEAKGRSPSSLTGALSDLAREGPAAESLTDPKDQDVGATPTVDVVAASGEHAGEDDSSDVNRKGEHENDTSVVWGPEDADTSAVAVIAELNLPTHGAYARAAQTQSIVTTPRSSKSTTSTFATCYVTEVVDAAVSHVMENRLSCVLSSAQYSQHGLVTATRLDVAEDSQSFGAADMLVQEPCALHTTQATDVAPPDEAKGRSPSSLTGALSDLAREGPAPESLRVVGVVPSSGPSAGEADSRNVNRRDEQEEDDISLGCGFENADINRIAVIAELILPTPGPSSRAAHIQSMVTTPRSPRSTTSTVATCYVTEMVDAAVSHVMENRLSIVEDVACRAPSVQDGFVTATQLGVAGGTQAVGALDTAFRAGSHDAEAPRSHASDATCHVADTRTAMIHSAYETGTSADRSVCPAVQLLNLSPSSSPPSSASRTSHKKSRSGQAAPSAIEQGPSADAHSVAKSPSSTSHATIAVAELLDPEDRLMLVAKLEHHSALLFDHRSPIDLSLSDCHGRPPPETHAPSATSSCGGPSDGQGKVAYKGLRCEANTRLLLAIREMEDGRLLVQATPALGSADEAMSLVVDDMDWAVTGMGPWQSLSAQEQQKLVATITDNLHVSTAALKVDWSAAASVPSLTAEDGGTATVRPEAEPQASAQSAALSARSISSDNQKVLCNAMTPLQGDVASHPPGNQQRDDSGTYIDGGMGLQEQDVTCERDEAATGTVREEAAQDVESQEVLTDQAEEDHEGETAVVVARGADGTATDLELPQHAVADVVTEQCSPTDRMLETRGGSDASADQLNTARSAASTASANAFTDRTHASSVANDFQVMKAAMSKRKMMESSLRDAAAEYRRWLSSTQIASPTPTDQSQAMAAAALGSDRELSPTPLMTVDVVQPGAWNHQRELGGWEAHGFDDDLRRISASAKYATRTACSPDQAVPGAAVPTDNSTIGLVGVRPFTDCAAATSAMMVVVASNTPYAPVTDAEVHSSTVVEIPQGTDSVDSARAVQATSPTHDLAMSGKGECGEHANHPDFVKGHMSFSSDRRPSKDSCCSSVDDPCNSAPKVVYKGIRRGANGQLLVSVRVCEDGQLLVRAVPADPACDDQLELALSHTDWAATGLGPLPSLSPDKQHKLVQTIVSNLHVVCEGGPKALKVELPTCLCESDYEGSNHSASPTAKDPRDGDGRTLESVQQSPSTGAGDTSEERTGTQLDGGTVSCSALHEGSYEETPSGEGQCEVHANPAKGAPSGDPEVREGSTESVDSALNADQREDKIERTAASPPASAPDDVALFNGTSRPDTEYVHRKSRTSSPAGLADASSGPAVNATDNSAPPTAVSFTSPAAAGVMASMKTSEGSSTACLGPQLPEVLETASTADPPKSLDGSSKASLSTDRQFEDSASSSRSSSELDDRLLFKGVRRTSRGRLLVSVREGTDCLVINAVPASASGVELLQLTVDEKHWQATGLGPWQTLAADEQDDVLNLIVQHLRMTVSGAGETTGLIIDWATACDGIARPGDASIPAAQHAADVDKLHDVRPGVGTEVRSSADESTDGNKTTACAASAMQSQQDGASHASGTSVVEGIAPALQRPALTSQQQQAEIHEPSSQKLHGGINADNEGAKAMVAPGQNLQEVVLMEQIGSGGEERVHVLDLQQAPSDAISCSSTTIQDSSSAAYHPPCLPIIGLTGAPQEFGPGCAESTPTPGREQRQGERTAEHVLLMRQHDSVLTARDGPLAEERSATGGLICTSQPPALLPDCVECDGPSEALTLHQGERELAEAIAEGRMQKESATATSVVRIPHASEGKLEMPGGLYTVPPLAEEKAAKLAYVELKLNENSPFIKLGPSATIGGSSQFDSGMLTTEPSIDADRKAASTAKAGTPALSATVGTNSRKMPTLFTSETQQEKQFDSAPTAAPMDTEKAEQVVTSHTSTPPPFQVADCSDISTGQVGTSSNVDIVAEKEQCDESNNRSPTMRILARKSPAGHTPRLTGPQEFDVVESKLRRSSSSASLNTLEPRPSDIQAGRDSAAEAVCQRPHLVVDSSNDSGDLDRHAPTSAEWRRLHEADAQRVTTTTPVLADAPSDLRSLAARQDCDDASCLSIVSHASSVVEQEGAQESHVSELSPSHKHHGAEQVLLARNVANAESKVEAGLPPRAPRTNLLRPLRRQSADIQRQARRSCANEAKKSHHEPRRHSVGDSYDGTALGSARSEWSAASDKTTSSLVFKGMKRTRSNSIMIISVAHDHGRLLVTCNIPSASLTLQHVMDDADWAHTGYGPWDTLTRTDRHKLVTVIVDDLHVTTNAESLPTLSIRRPPTAPEPSSSQWSPARQRKRTGDMTASQLQRIEQAQDTSATTERKTYTADVEDGTSRMSGVDTRQSGQSYVSAASDRSTGSVVYKGLRRAPSKSVMIVSVTQDDEKLLIEASIPSSSESSRYVIDDLDWQQSTGLGPWGVLTADERSRLVDVIARNLQVRDTDTIEIVGIDWPISALNSAREEPYNDAEVAVATAAGSGADGSQRFERSIRVIETMGTQRSGTRSAVVSSARLSKKASSPVVCEVLHLAPLASTVIASVSAEGDGGLAMKGTAKAPTESVECEVDWACTGLSSWELLKTSEHRELLEHRPVSVPPSPHGLVNGDDRRRRAQGQQQSPKGCDDLLSTDGLPFDASLDGSYACATGQRSSGSEDVFLDHSSFVCSNSGHLMDSTASEAEEGLTWTSAEGAEKQGCRTSGRELSDGRMADEASKLGGGQNVQPALEMLPPELSVDAGKL